MKIKSYNELAENLDYLSLDDLFRMGLEVDKPDSDGIYILNPVCRELNLEFLEKLVRAGADVDSKSSDGMTPMLSALENCHIYPEKAAFAIRFLLDNGADIEKRGEWDKTPFLKSCTRGVIQITQLLVERGCNIYAQSHEIEGEVGAIELSELPSNSVEFKMYIKSLFGE